MVISSLPELEKSGTAAIEEIERRVNEKTEIEFEEVLRIRLIEEQVSRGVRLKYLNRLAASIPPQPHYLTLTESFVRMSE